jgi:hypothetical protein
MKIEEFDLDRDLEHAYRVWQECGWLDPSDEKMKDGVKAVFGTGRSWVVRMDGATECITTCATGTIRQLEEDLPFSGVTSVTTSRVARKQGFAARLTAHAIAEEARSGSIISGLCFFEQGFYDRLGFGTGPQLHLILFDPQTLNVPFQKRPPKRLCIDDYEKMHRARLANERHHGYLTFDNPLMTKSDQCDTTNGFGLGYENELTGELTHHIWFNVEDSDKMANGPYNIEWMTYQNPEQFLELMGVIRSLGDQVRLIRLIEPSQIQIQDLLLGPVQNRMTTHGGAMATNSNAMALWQNRINDLEACLKRTHLLGDTTQFNLVLSDPIDQYLDSEESWRGVGGEYLVTLGPESNATRGSKASLPTLKTTVNAFTRLWCGAATATGLTYTDTFDASPELIKELDRCVCIPSPGREWDF